MPSRKQLPKSDARLTHGQALQHLKGDIESAFRNVDFDRKEMLTFSELKDAILALGLRFTPQEVCYLFSSNNKNGMMTQKAFGEMFYPPYLPAALRSAFMSSDVNKDGLLEMSEVHNALMSIGINFSEMEGRHLALRSVDANVGWFKPKFQVSFYLFCKICSPACILMHRFSSCPEYTAVKWNDLVKSIHTIAGVLAGGMLSFVPKPSYCPCPVSTKPFTVPLIAQPHKTLSARSFDALMMGSFILWTGMFLLAKHTIGTYWGRAFDAMSVFSAIVLLCTLMSYLSWYMVLMTFLGTLAFGVVLYLLRRKQ